MGIKTALILAAHGSDLRPEAAQLIWHLVESLRALNVFDLVTAAFRKGEPALTDILATLDATDITDFTVVPLFTGSGYFTRTAIPEDMGLTGTITEREGRIIRYARPVGEHPMIVDILRERVRGAVHLTPQPPLRQQRGGVGDPEVPLFASGVGGFRGWGEFALVVIGHGTRRNSDSRLPALTMAETLRGDGIAAEVVTVFLEDDPPIPTWRTLTHAPMVIFLPFFFAPGSHALIDLPAQIGLSVGQTSGNIDGRDVIYLTPFGDDPRIPAIILDLAREVGGMA